MQKPSRDKGFQRERDICLHFAHCPQLSNRFVFVFARVRPPRTRRRGARSNLGHCHPRHILGARQRGLQKAAEQLWERSPRRARATRGWQGLGGHSNCLRRPRARALCSARAEGTARPAPTPPFCPRPSPRQSTFLTPFWGGRASGSQPTPMIPPPKH